MNYNIVCCDHISKKMLGLLTEFSDYINRMAKLNVSLLTSNVFNMNIDFMEYIDHFDMGRYYHFRCMGYMESLVLTRCYSPGSLCYWKDMLVMPAYNNITSALDYLDKVKSDPKAELNPTFNELIVETEGLKKVAMEIMDTIGYYNLPC